MVDITNRRRPITSCLECYRRKLKCNRIRPCNQCCARRAPEKCYFSGDRASSDTPSTTPLPQITPPDINSNDDGDKPIPSSLVDRAGYAATPGSSTFVRLKQEDVYQYCPAPSIVPSIPQQGVQHEYLRLVARLPPPDVVGTLLEFFVRDLYWVFIAVDEDHLRTVYRDWLNVPPEGHLRGSPDTSQRELLYFPGLLFQVLAQIVQHLSPQHPSAKALGLKDYSDCRRLSQTFYLVGSRLISILGRQYPTLCSVEHDLVSCSWLKDSGRGTEAWHRLGDAIRQAQELGLHRLPKTIEQTGTWEEQDLVRFLDLEHRKRVWTRLFTLDSVGALLLGRPRLLHREDISTPAPLDWDYSGDTGRVLPLSGDNSAEAGGMLFLTLAHRIHNMLAFSANGIFAQDYSKVLELHEGISSLREKASLLLHGDQSTATTPSIKTLRVRILRLTLINTVNAVLMALHRPFIASHPPSRSAAINAALDGMDLQHSIFDLVPHPQNRLYATTLSTIEASVFLCGIMMDLPPRDPVEDRRIRQAILLAIGRLAATKDWSPLAEAGEQVLRQFYHKVQAARRLPFEQTGWLQPDTLHGAMFQGSSDQLRDIAIPSPQQPPQEMYQSLFGNGQASLEPFGLLDRSDSTPEGFAPDDLGRFPNQDEILWPDFYEIP
ncbi:hypothetical protein LTR20_007118 [Exophiala xenobiotica]|nr:hypothetical protein LTR40_008405 [Exophiala xenobiotica]KAK5380442.1 hypothetical protein LTS13_003299 [Exophiala xenobiotica]KAK5393110.1 hypothetical protein LTR79_009423 [Exophiala xenobiotica]KAK5412120.1 hypothetical protein LTR90_007683 [Exophiala xenobiotica]KAK5422398.1 hypothetical protein LTR06_000655 [Exophiala xenobiotica]